MSDTKTKKLENKVADLGALSVMAAIFSLFSFFACIFFLFKTADTEWNAVQTALTIFEIFIVLSLAMGFWVVRKEAMDKAENTAKEVAKDCVNEQMREYTKTFLSPSLVREIIAQSEDLGGGAQLSSENVDDMKDSLE